MVIAEGAAAHDAEITAKTTVGMDHKETEMPHVTTDEMTVVMMVRVVRMFTWWNAMSKEEEQTMVHRRTTARLLLVRET